MSNILVFGANGQIGARLSRALSAAGHTVTALTRAECDLATIEAKPLESQIRATMPEMIINAAAYTAVDKAETEAAQALYINGEIPKRLARIASIEHVPLVHFSTDYVFDGVRGRYAEDSTPSPLNAYGRSKLAGEEAVLAEGGYVFRLQWVYDTRGQNFFLTMQRMLREKPELSVVADQIGAPSSARDIATALTALAPTIIARDLAPGAYHLVARGITSWHGFACAIAEAMGSASRIHPITSEEYPLLATRPKDGRLLDTKLAAFGVTMPHWRDGLSAVLAETQ